MEESKSVRDIHLEQLRAGDEASMKPFADSLADSLLYVPTVVEKHEEDENGQIKIKVITLASDQGKTIPVFSSKALFTEWCQSQEDFFNTVSLFGGDIAEVLANGEAVLLDAGAEQEFLVNDKILRIMRGEVVETTAETKLEDVPVQEEVQVQEEVAEAETEVEVEVEEPVVEEQAEVEQAAQADLPETEVVELTTTLDEFLAEAAGELENEAAEESPDEVQEENHDQAEVSN